MEQFYDDIERAMADSNSKYKIITEDFNAKIGTKTKEEDFKSIRAFGVGERNERGDRLIEFAVEHNLIIANTLFQKPKNRYWTWESPDGETRNQIDSILSSQRGIVTNYEVFTKANIGSDHRLVGITLRINKRSARLKTIKKQKPFNINTQKLRGMKEIFEMSLKNRFEKLEEEVTAHSFSEIVKEEANKLASKTKDEAPVLSTEDKKIKQLEDRRKELRKKEDRSQREKIEYTELNKTVKKKCRQRSRKKGTDHVETILQSGRGPKLALRLICQSKKSPSWCCLILCLC